MASTLKLVSLVLSLTISAISIDTMTKNTNGPNGVEISSFGLSITNICYVLITCIITFFFYIYQTKRSTIFYRYLAYQDTKIHNEYVSQFCNILFILTIAFSLSYNCVVIYYNRTNKPIDRDLINMSYACLVLTSINILFILGAWCSRDTMIGGYKLHRNISPYSPPSATSVQKPSGLLN